MPIEYVKEEGFPEFSWRNKTPRMSLPGFDAVEGTVPVLPYYDPGTLGREMSWASHCHFSDNLEMVRFKDNEHKSTFNTIWPLEQ